jgi:predicted nuclease of predicted toxin-antitoxin system
MKVLLDNNFPPPFRHEFPFCEVETAGYRGWASLDDDELLRQAEGIFDVLVTLDTNLVHQRNIALYEIGIVVLDVHPIILPNLKRYAGMVRSMIWPASVNGEAIRITEDRVEPIGE